MLHPLIFELGASPPRHYIKKSLKLVPNLICVEKINHLFPIRVINIFSDASLRNISNHLGRLSKV